VYLQDNARWRPLSGVFVFCQFFSSRREFLGRGDHGRRASATRMDFVRVMIEPCMRIQGGAFAMQCSAMICRKPSHDFPTLTYPVYLRRERRPQSTARSKSFVEHRGCVKVCVTSRAGYVLEYRRITRRQTGRTAVRYERDD